MVRRPLWLGTAGDRRERSLSLRGGRATTREQRQRQYVTTAPPHATDCSGNWTWLGGNTYNEHDYGGDQYTYSGAGSYSRNFAANNVGTLKGTTSGSGDGSDSDY